MTNTAAADRLIALIADPVSLVAIGLASAALFAIAVVSRRKTRAAAPAPTRAFAPPPPVPLLDTPMQPTLAAPRRAPGMDGAAKGLSLLSGLAFAAIGVAAFGGLIAFALKIAGTTPLPAEPLPQTAGVWQDDVTVIATGPAGCEAGLDGHRASYTHCGASVPVTFEVVGLAKDGKRLTDAVWSGADRRAFVLTAKDQPAPFTLSRGADLLAAPGATLGEYDAYIAVGYADETRDGDDARARAEARSFALADLTLREVRGSRPRDCRSDVMVHAVSLGVAKNGPVPAPLLIGVHIDDRVNRPVGDAGDLNAMLNGLFATGGARITGLNPADYGPWDVLGSQRACKRPPV